MSKPSTLKDLLALGQISLHDVHNIARTLFDGKTTGAGPEGYVITACNFDDLAAHVKGFITKGILEFTIENVLDAKDYEVNEDTPRSELRPDGDTY